MRLRKDEGAFVGIVGRPNVGKSTLFNALIKKRKSLVRNEPGVTRDFLVEKASWWGKSFQVVDMGGLSQEKDFFSKTIFKNVLEVSKQMDLFIFVLDGKTGFLPEDKEILRFLQKTGKPFFTVINKVDEVWSAEEKKIPFYSLGISMHTASFEKKEGLDVLVEWILDKKPQPILEKKKEDLCLVVMGKPNAGKSSLCNYLLGKKRILVSPFPGTTRDCVEDEFVREKKRIKLVDTSGLRASSRVKESVEKLTSIKSKKSLIGSDIALLVLDGMEEISHQDVNILEDILKAHKPVILVVNKTDIARRKKAQFRKNFRLLGEDKIHFYKDIPMVFVSAKTGEGMEKLFQVIFEIEKKLETKISTSELNRFFFDVIRKAPSPTYGTENVKLYYLTQTHQKPPSFIAFANHPEGVKNAYKRFLIKNIKKRWNLQSVPIRIFIMKRS